MDTQTTPNYDNVIFFDGVCGLCNGFVDFVMAIDKEEKFKFSPLQSEFAQKNLPPEMTANLDSVVFLKQGKTYRKSKAVIRILEDMGGIWKFATIGKVMPEKLLNSAYDLVAKIVISFLAKKKRVDSLRRLSAHAS